MKYFSISPSTDLQDIGFYPQARIREEFNSQTHDSYLKVDPYIFPDFNPKYELTLADKAIATDIIDRSALIFGSVVSPKFKSILERMNLPPHKFYDVKVYHKEKILKYHWFHHVANMWNFINLAETKIQIFNIRTNTITEERTFSTVEEIKQEKKKLKHSTAMRFESILLTENFPGYDFFELTDVQYANLISENLKKIIDQESITGCALKEYNKIRTGN